MIRFLAFFICTLLVLYNYNKRRVVSSNSLWVFCYFMIFVLYPTVTKDSYIHTSLIDICAFVGILSYAVGVFSSEQIKINTKTAFLYPKYKMSVNMYYVVIALFVVAAIYVVGTQGISQLLAGSMTANELTFGNDSNANIIIYLMNLMVPFVLAIWVSADTKFEKKNRYLYLALFLGISVVFGYTRLYLICVLIMLVFYQIRKVPQTKQCFILGIAILVVIAAMVLLNFIRYIGTAELSDLSSMIDISYVFESTDFSASYKWFDELLSHKSPYIVPLTYLKPLFVFIPRSIWPTKPEPISLDILRMVNPELIQLGYSTAGNSVLGEGYAVLGYLGIVIFPFLWGFICNLLDRKYYYRLSIGADSCLNNIFYYIFSTFIVISAQRGDWSQYTVIIVWLFMFPLYLVSKFTLRFGNKNNTVYKLRRK